MFLSFDDLVRIFEYLELKDQLNVARACPIFHDIIVNSIWRRRFTTICLAHQEENENPKDHFNVSEQIKKLNKDDYQEFFRWNVANLRRLKLDNLIAQYWKHFLGHNLMRPGMDYYLTFHYTRLIELACVNVTLIFHDGTMRHMATHCPMVETLTVSSKNVTGQFLTNFRYLKSLSLANCTLKVANLSELLEKSKSLEFLDIRGNTEFLHIMMPTWGQSLIAIQLDEEAFLKQFVWAHDLPARFKNIRSFSISCRNAENELRQESRDNLNQWLPLLQGFGAYIESLKLFTNATAIFEAMQSIYTTNGAPIFERLRDLHFKADRMELECLKYFYDSSKLKTVNIYCKNLEYYLSDVIRLIENCEKLTDIVMDLGVALEAISWRFLDDLINFKRQHKIKKTLKVILQQTQRSCIPDYFGLSNEKELKQVRDELFVLHKRTICFDFGLEISFKLKTTARENNTELIEIGFSNEELKPKMKIQNFSEDENVFKESY